MVCEGGKDPDSLPRDHWEFELMQNARAQLENELAKAASKLEGNNQIQKVLKFHLILYIFLKLKA